MRVTMNDGAVFEGADAKSIVRQMKRDDWGAPPKKTEYMTEVAERVEGMDPLATIRATDATTFLVDLRAANLCTIEHLTAAQAEEFAAIIPA